MPEIVADNISIVDSTELEGATRIEAGYYQPQHLSLMESLKKVSNVPLGSIAVVTDGIHASIDYDDKSNIYCLSAQSVKQGYFDSTAKTMISAAQHNANMRTNIQSGDVIVSSMGTIGFAAVANKNMLPANAVRQVLIIRLKNNLGELYPYFLSVFPNSKYGLFQSLREATGNVQQHLFIDKVQKFIIPQFSDVKKISVMYKDAEKKLAESENLYSQAKLLLLEELGIKDIDPSHVLGYEVNSADTISVKRIDAEYYQPKYENMISTIQNKSKTYKSVKQMRSFNARGLQPIYNIDGKLKVINSKHILEQNLDYENFESTDERNWDLQKEARVFKHDILIYTTGANVGRTNIYLDDAKALASNHVNILRLRESNPIYVSVVLNSIIGRLQTKRLVSGSAQVELYPSDIDKFIIPFIEASLQEQIVSLVEESFKNKRRAKGLLEEAKQTVEEMIEKGAA